MSVNEVHQEREQDSRAITVPKTARDYIRYAVIAFAAFWILLVGVIAVGRFAGFSTATVLSQSMEPVANVEDLLITQPFDGNVVLNDIYIFDSPADGHQTSHRIIAQGDTSDTWITKGDANKTQDIQQITTAAINSHVIAVIPRFLNAFPFLDSLPGRLLTLGIPFLLMIAPMLKRRAEDAGARSTSTLKSTNPVRLRVITAFIGFGFLVLVGIRSFLGFTVATIPVTADSHGLPTQSVVLLQPRISSTIQNGDYLQVTMPGALSATIEKVKTHSIKLVSNKNLVVIGLENSSAPSGLSSVQVDPNQRLYAAVAVIPYIGAILPGIGSPAGFAAIIGLLGTAGTLLLMYGVAARPVAKKPEQITGANDQELQHQ
ncbi:MAG: hypothetical protein PHN51_00390 [Candidatus Nanopelagicales bacterium]|nr:hypothetical protein [Candidatus Nanopelagicales bacterium]